MTVGEGAEPGDIWLICVGPDRLQLVYRNAKQMKKIVEAKYSGLRFDESVLNSQNMGFECSPTVRMLIYNEMRFANSTQGALNRRPVSSLPMARRAKEAKER